MALSPHAPAHLANNLSGDMAGTRNPTTAVSPKTRHTPQEKGGPTDYPRENPLTLGHFSRTAWSVATLTIKHPPCQNLYDRKSAP